MNPDSPTLADIRRQPQVLARLLARLGEIRTFAHEHLSPDPSGCLYAYGCGDGYFAARAAAPALTGGAGMAYSAHSALDLLLYQSLRLGPADRVLAISMSGNVDRGLEAATASREAGCPVALLTNGDGGRLGEVGPRFELAIPSLAPFLCGTSSYLATLATLLLAFPPRPDNVRAVEDTAVDELVQTLPDVIDTAHRDLTALAAARGAAFTGVRLLTVGPHRASAEYGAAKLVELTRLPVWSDDLEEFAHRQFWSADPGELVVFLVPTPAFAALANASAEALGDMGFTTLALSLADEPLPAVQHQLTLPSVPEALAGLAFAPPLQLLAYHLALATGLDPDTRAHLKDDSLRFTTSRRLTRRSLIGSGQ